MTIEVQNCYNQLNTHTYQNVDVIDGMDDNTFTVICKDTDRKLEYPYGEYNWEEIEYKQSLLTGGSNLIIDAPKDCAHTMTIQDCDQIILNQKGIEVKVNIPIENFDAIEYLTINKYKFKRVK